MQRIGSISYKRIRIGNKKGWIIKLNFILLEIRYRRALIREVIVRRKIKYFIVTLTKRSLVINLIGKWLIIKEWMLEQFFF